MARVLVSFSGGKDSLLALHRTLARYDRNDIGLHVLVHPDPAGDRIRFHRVPLELIFQQAEALALPLRITRIEDFASNAEFEEAIRADWAKWKKQDGLHTVVFGDVHNEQVMDYKQQLCDANGLNAAFPLAGGAARVLADEWLDQGGQAVVCLAERATLPEGTAGRAFDRAFIAGLPEGVDPVGEAGEFHTLASHFPPLFGHPIHLRIGARHTATWPTGEAYEWVELSKAEG